MSTEKKVAVITGALLDKKRSATSNVQNPDEVTLDQVLSRISALAPVVAQYVRDMEQDRRLP
jgi:hypothetical protein